MNETQFRDLAESLPQLLWTCRGDGPCDYLSPQWMAYTGLPDADLLGFGWLKQLHPDDRERTIAAWNAAVTSNTPFDVEFRILRKDGIYRWFKTRAIAQHDDEGRIIKWFGSNTDVEEQKRVEETLRASEARYRSYVDVTGQIAWVTSPAGEIVEDVPSLRKFTGQTYEEAKGSGWAKTIHPDDLERTLQVWTTAVATKSHYETEYRMRRHDGVYRLLLARGFPVFGEDGTIREWVGTCSDITERVQVEKKLQESKDYLENLLNYANAPIIVWDPQFHITRFNHAFEALTGRPEREVIGKSLELLFPREQIDSSMALIKKTTGGARWETVEIAIIHRDGSLRTVLWNSATIFDADGTTPVATIAQGHDITLRKQARTHCARARSSSGSFSTGQRSASR